MVSSPKYSSEFRRENRGRELMNTAIALGGLETLFVALFLISRYINKSLNGMDIYLMLAAFLSDLTLVILDICEWLIWNSEKTTDSPCAPVMVTHGGAGRHVLTLSTEEITRLLKLGIGAYYAYALSVTIPRLSILCLYLRIFTTRPFRYACFAAGSLIILTFLASLIVSFMNCVPYAYQWDKSIPGGRCLDHNPVYRAISFPNVVADLAMLVIPIVGIWHLNIQLGHKIGVIVTFLSGSV